MIKIIALFVAISIYTVGTLINNFSSDTADDSTEIVAQDKNKNSLFYAVEMAGLKVSNIPNSGCSESLLSVEKINELLSYLTQQQQTALGNLLNSSSSVWSVQFYIGFNGAGLCLPEQQKMVLLPLDIADTVSPIQEYISPSAP